MPRRRSAALRRIGARHEAPRRPARARAASSIGSPATLRVDARRRRHRRRGHRCADGARCRDATAAGARRRARSGAVSSPACWCSPACTAIGWAIVDPARAFAATVAVLVVACPCAFALAAPAAVTRALAVLQRPRRAGRASGCARGSRRGHARPVRQDGNADRTAGSRRTARRSLRDIGRDAALALAAALAQGSRHPLARAFTAAAPRDAAAGRLRAKASRAAASAASIGGRRYRLGRADYALARLAAAADLDDAVILADDDGAIAAFHVDERLQPGARAPVDALARDGLIVRDREWRREGEGRVGCRGAWHRDLGCAPVACGQACVARVAARDRRARHRRRRRRERCPDARRCRRRRGGELGRRRWRRRRATSWSPATLGALADSANARAADARRSCDRTGAGRSATTSPPCRSPRLASCRPGSLRSACRRARSPSC